MATKDTLIALTDCRGGQNSADPPHALTENQAVQAQNVEWYRSAFGRKRRGSRLSERDSGSALPTGEKFKTLIGFPFAAYAGFQVLAQAATTGFLSWGTTAPSDDWEVGGYAPTDAACVVLFNNKVYYLFDTAVNRMFFMSLGSMAFGAYVGLAAPGTPGVVKSGGAVTDTRKYRAVTTGSTFNTRSEPSTATVAQALAAQQASNAAPGTATSGQDFYDGWELQAATIVDNYATWWVVGTAGSTTAIVDNTVSLFTLNPAPQEGLFNVPLSHRYGEVDGNRMLFAGAYESTSSALQQRVWFTPVLGDRDQGDDQRVPSTTALDNWVDIDAGDEGGDITGFGPATLGEVLVFKRMQLWRLSRTGNLDAPYIPRAIDKSYGTFGYRTVCAGQDETGGPCVYFASSRGPCRLSRAGPEYLGYAIEDIWATVNQHGNVHLSQHAIYYTDRGQYWLWVSVGAATVPSVLLIFTVRSAAWAVYTGPLATAQCSAMLPRYISEANKGITTANVLTAPLVPYCCPNTNGQIVECDAINPQTGVALDTDLETYSGSGSVWNDGTAYQATLTSRPVPKALDRLLTLNEASVQADMASGVTLGVSFIKDYGASQRDFTVSLSPDGSETIIDRKVQASGLANAKNVQVKIGDAAAVASQWNIHAVQLRVKEEADQ